MPPIDAETASLRREEASVEAHSAGLRKELGLTDLALTQILFIVGLPWVGVAAKQGRAHVVFWLLAIALFYSRRPPSSSTSIGRCRSRAASISGPSSGSTS